MKIQRILTIAATLLGLAIFTTSCGPSTKRGAVIGGLGGAGVGGIIGNQSGRGLEGAAIGGAVGTAAGALWGSAKDDERATHHQHQGHHDDRYHDDRYRGSRY